MADIDDELLALAGEASSDEEADAPMNISRESTAAPKMSAKGGSTKKSDGKKARRQNDSEEEGEAGSSPDSLKSAPMDESDSDDDPSPTNFSDEGDRYPVDGKFMNSADKHAIMAMPEIKREQVLAERAQEVERDRQNRALRQLLNAREAESKKQDKKRKAGAADLDENQRKTSRQRTKLGGGKVGEASTGIDSLKRARAEKTDRQRRRDEEQLRNPRSRLPVQDDYADEDADGDSEVEWEDPNTRNKKSKSPDYRDSEPANLTDINRVRVGRSRFAMVCFYPGFDEAINGCYVRIVIGVDKETGQNVYRMALIKGFVEDKAYALETPNGKQIRTTQYIRAAHGKSERNWPFITCSDSAITEGEWERYRKTCIVEGVPLPTRSKLDSKITDINNLVHRKWTEAELQEKLTKSGVLNKKFLPIERQRLNNLINDARAAGKDQRVEELREELAALEGPKLAYSSPKKQPAASTGPSQQERLAELNRQNRRKNIEEVRQAQIAERKAARALEAAIARGEATEVDHSRRTKTLAKVKHDVSAGKKTDSQAASGTTTPAVGTPELPAKKVSTALEQIAKIQAANANKKGLPQIRRPVMDDDIIGSLDLGIDIEI